MAEEQKDAKAKLADGVAEIRALSPDYKVTRLSGSHFRIDDRLDLYPLNRRYHHLGTEKRGTYTDARAVCKQFLSAWKHHLKLDDN